MNGRFLKSKNKYYHAVRTMLVSGMAYAVSYGINLVLTPFITENLGTEAYGFVTLARQFAQYATILTTALNSFAARYIAVGYHQKDHREANCYFSSVFFGDVVLSSGIMAAVLFFLLFLERLLNVSAHLVADVKILFLLVFVNFWVTTVFSVFHSAAYIKNKLDITGIFKGISYLTEALVLAVVYILFPARVFYVGIGLIAATFVVAAADLWICRKYTPELQIRRKSFSWSAVRRLILGGIWSSMNSVGEMLNSGLDLLVCNLMLSPVAMGQLAVAKTISSIFSGLFSMVAQAFQPMFLKSYAQDDREGLLLELKRAMKLSGMLSNLGFAGFAALGMVYFQLWIPGENIPLVYSLTLITVLTHVPGGPMQPLYYIYILTVKRMVPCLVTLAGGMLNVAAMYLLITYTDMGVYAVVWTTAAVMAVINLITNPLYMAHVLRLPWHTFYGNIIRNLLSCGTMVLMFRGFFAVYQPEGWFSLIVCAAVYAAAGAVLHFVIVCEKNDWYELKRRIHRFVEERK